MRCPMGRTLTLSSAAGTRDVVGHIKCASFNATVTIAHLYVDSITYAAYAISAAALSNLLNTQIMLRRGWEGE